MTIPYFKEKQVSVILGSLPFIVYIYHFNEVLHGPF